MSILQNTMNPIVAIAVFSNDITGCVKFTEHNDTVRIDVNIKGLKPNSLHGFHVHEAGDLGNLQANKKGEAKYYYYDNKITWNQKKYYWKRINYSRR